MQLSTMFSMPHMQRPILACFRASRMARVAALGQLRQRLRLDRGLPHKRSKFIGQPLAFCNRSLHAVAQPMKSSP